MYILQEYLEISFCGLRERDGGGGGHLLLALVVSQLTAHPFGANG